MSGVEAFLGIAGAALSAAGSISSANAQERAAEFNAAVLRQRAERERQLAALEEDEFRRDQRRLSARQRALFGKAGVSFEGTPLLVLQDTAAEAEFQARKIRAGGAAGATRLDQRAELERLRGSARRDARLLGAGTSLLRRGGDAASRLAARS